MVSFAVRFEITFRRVVVVMSSTFISIVFPLRLSRLFLVVPLDFLLDLLLVFLLDLLLDFLLDLLLDFLLDFPLDFSLDFSLDLLLNFPV